MKRDYAAIAEYATARIDHAMRYGTHEDVLAEIEKMQKEDDRRWAADDAAYERRERILMPLITAGWMVGAVFVAALLSSFLAPALVGLLLGWRVPLDQSGAMLMGAGTFLVLCVLACLAPVGVMHIVDEVNFRRRMRPVDPEILRAHAEATTDLLRKLQGSTTRATSTTEAD